jgi:hypothetical protein
MRTRVLIGGAALALLVAVFALMLILTGDNATSARQIPGIGVPDYVITGSDDTLYLFSGNNVTAVASDGSQMWVKRLNKADYPFRTTYIEDGVIYAASPYAGEVPPAGNFQVYPNMPFDSKDNLYILDSIPTAGGRTELAVTYLRTTRSPPPSTYPACTRETTSYT